MLRDVGSNDYHGIGIFDASNSAEAIKSAVMGGAGDGHYVAVGSRFWSEHRIATVQSLVVEDLSPSVGLSHPEPEPLDISPLLTPQAH